MEDLNINVGKEFCVKIKKVTKDKSGYICQTDRGMKVIKRVYLQPKHILFQNDVKKHLYKNGFENIDMYELSYRDIPYVEYGNNIYVMTSHMEINNISFQNIDHWKKVIQTVAQAHKTLKNVYITSEPIIKSDINIVEYYNKKINGLNSYKKRVSKQGNLTDFDYFFIKDYEYYMGLMIKSKDMLDQSHCDKIFAQAKQNNTACHNFLKEENLLLQENTVYMTNFTESSIAPTIMDLAYIIKQYIKLIDLDSSCDTEKGYMPFDEIIGIYNDINPISKEEKQMLYPLLLFPIKFSKICDEYYQKKRSFVPSAMRIRIEKLADKKNKIEQFISPYAF